MMAWFSSSDANTGVIAQAVSPTGAPASGPLTMPGTTVMKGGPARQRTGLAARAGNGGFYVASAVGYPSPNRIRLWRVGSGSAQLVAKASGTPATTVVADDNGRLWVTWSSGTFGDKRVYARRSNRTATVWGATVSAGVTKGTNDVYALDGAATDDALDVLALFGIGTGQDHSTWVKRVHPGLTLKASRSSLPKQPPKSVTFTVLDAGDPVKGAKVKVSGRSGTTNGKGKVTFTLKDHATARASADGYVGARVHLR
jgi:hypothetical protein